ncbi:MAG: hypothetical protein Q9219_004497 [cf. Caloplaca sp. 3 TL-2023]
MHRRGFLLQYYLLVFSIAYAMDGTTSPGSSTTVQLLSKRTYFVHCPNDPLPPHFGPPNVSQDPAVRAFKSLTALCTDYDDGVGISCDEDGYAVLPTVLSRLARQQMGYYVERLCQEKCSCEDIGPNLPPSRQERRPGVCASSSSSGSESESDPRGV